MSVVTRASISDSISSHGVILTTLSQHNTQIVLGDSWKWLFGVGAIIVKEYLHNYEFMQAWIQIVPEFVLSKYFYL